jgi:hypothetical protein
MQKVEGSNPFSRFEKGPQTRAFCVPASVLRATSPETVSQTHAFIPAAVLCA